MSSNLEQIQEPKRIKVSPGVRLSPGDYAATKYGFSNENIDSQNPTTAIHLTSLKVTFHQILEIVSYVLDHIVWHGLELDN